MSCIIKYWSVGLMRAWCARLDCFDVIDDCYEWLLRKSLDDDNVDSNYVHEGEYLSWDVVCIASRVKEPLYCTRCLTRNMITSKASESFLFFNFSRRKWWRGRESIRRNKDQVKQFGNLWLAIDSLILLWYSC